MAINFNYTFARKLNTSMTKDEKEKYLVDNGWSTWYNDDYWVHPEIVDDSSFQDYTNYGMDLDAAVKYQTKHRLLGIPDPRKQKMGPTAAWRRMYYGKFENED
jgi:hypothetical protein